MEGDLRTAADELADSVVVCGVGECGDALATRAFRNARIVPTAAVADGVSSGVAAVLVAVDPSEPDDVVARLRAFADIDAFTVALIPDGGGATDAVWAIRDHVDGLLLVATGAGDGSAAERVDGSRTDTDGGSRTDGDVVADGVREFLDIVQAPGFVNLDLTDARTVLSSGIAALGSGSAARDAPAAAVEASFARLPDDVDPSDASAVLVDVVVDPDTSITAATDAIAAVRDRIVPEANVIWGGAVDDAAADELTVRTVVADVRYAPRLAAGDPCPRCGSPLSTYAFGASETLACDGCGYSGIAVRRE